jgi:hypothetical protein
MVDAGIVKAEATLAIHVSKFWIDARQEALEKKRNFHQGSMYLCGT